MSRAWAIGLGFACVACGDPAARVRHEPASGAGAVGGSGAEETGGSWAQGATGGVGPGSGGSGGAPPEAGSGGSAAEPPFDAGIDAPPPNVCPEPALPPGDHTLDLVHGGTTRSYILHVPLGYANTAPTPLVLNLHGLTESAMIQALSTGMNETADEHAFLVAYPTGLDASWNGGGGVCCGPSGLANTDDVGFSIAVVDDVAARVCLDRKRVYATGMSAGGVMAHRLACEAAHVFAAIGPVAGTLSLPADQCHPSRPVPVLHFHGTADSAAPYAGGLLPGAVATAAGWAARDGCTDAAPLESFRNGDTHCDTWSACPGGASVTLCTIDGGGHCWPGGHPPCAFGTMTQSVSANSAMWSLFEKSALP